MTVDLRGIKIESNGEMKPLLSLARIAASEDGDGVFTPGLLMAAGDSKNGSTKLAHFQVGAHQIKSN